MRSLLVLALSFAFAPLAEAGFSLSGQKEIPAEIYNAQLAAIRDKVRSSIKTTGSMEVYEDELSVAPLVVDIDFQKIIKVAQGVSVLGEYSSWIDLELGIWGFEQIVDEADNKISARLEEKLGGEIYSIVESTKSERSRLIYFPVKMPDLNRSMPSRGKTLIAFDSFGFDASDLVKVTNLELADAAEHEGVVFFPYINLALHKQSATTSQMNGELMINYVAAMNGYFALCIKAGCFTASLPKNSYIDLIIPLVHRKEATTDETHIAALKYSQDLIAKMIAEFTMAAFEELSKPEE